MPRPQSAGRRRRRRPPKQQAARSYVHGGGGQGGRGGGTSFGDEWGAGPQPAASPALVAGRGHSRGNRRRANPREGKQQVVTLDGVAIPLVDPQNFQEFWREREEQRQRDPRPVYAAAPAPASGTRFAGSLGTDPDRDASSPLGFYTANTQRQQGAVTVYGEGTPTRDSRHARRGADHGDGASPRSGGGRIDRPARSPPSRAKAFRRKQRERPQSAQHSSSRTSSRGGGRKPRPQSAQPAKRRRPKSAGRMASTAGAVAGRDYGARKRAGAPAAMMVTGSEADRRRVIERYARSIKEQRRVRPTTSSEYLKLRAARRRAAAKDFADSLAEEEKRRKIEVRAQVIEANKWSIMLSTEHSFSVVEDPSAGVHELAVHVMSTGERGNVLRKLGVAAFQREYEKMKSEVDRKKALRALSASASADGSFEGADGGGGGGNARPSRGRSRRVVQSELKSILRDTERLTDTLVRQLRELKACGWNTGYL